MKIVKRIVALILVIVLLGAIAWVTMEVASYFNTTSLTYDGRTYTKSSREVDADTLEMISTLDDTGVAVKGMEVFDDLDNPYDSTVIYLKTQDDTFLSYELSGGP